MAEIENLKIGNGGTLHIVGNEDIVANSWEAGKTYVKNKSYVIREHKLYVCNVTHTSVEPFDATKWTEITIGDAIGNNIGDLSTLTTTDKSSLVGAVNEVNGRTKWTRLGNYVGSDSADISSIFATANELKITARNYTSGQVASSQVYTVVIGTNEITDFLAGGFTELHYLDGMNNGQSNVIDFVINSTTIRIATFLLNGNDVKRNANTGFKVYYR